MAVVFSMARTFGTHAGVITPMRSSRISSPRIASTTSSQRAASLPGAGASDASKKISRSANSPPLYEVMRYTQESAFVDTFANSNVNDSRSFAGLQAMKRHPLIWGARATAAFTAESSLRVPGDKTSALSGREYGPISQLVPFAMRLTRADNSESSQKVFRDS